MDQETSIITLDTLRQEREELERCNAALRLNIANMEDTIFRNEDQIIVLDSHIVALEDQLVIHFDCTGE